MEAIYFFVNLFSGRARSMCYFALCVTAEYDAVQLNHWQIAQRYCFARGRNARIYNFIFFILRWDIKGRNKGRASRAAAREANL
jgi:hypothetical protein